MIYKETWDLTTIPDKPFASEHGRRMSARRKTGAVKLVACPGCGVMRTAKERRKRCACGQGITK